MLSYNHIYHAGCAADVFKHTVLSLILHRLNLSQKPYTVIDTHAGRGIYDMQDERAQKTGEAALGIKRFAQYATSHGSIDEVAPYINAIIQSQLVGAHIFCTASLANLPDNTIVSSLDNPFDSYPVTSPAPPPAPPSSCTLSLDGLTFYPGSPFIEHYLMRPCDNLILCELHPTEIEQLRQVAASFSLDTAHPAPAVHHRDGYEAAVALTPPLPRRGLLFIDPSYEDAWEYSKVCDVIKKVLRRWPQGRIALWYPVLEKRNAEREGMLRSIKSQVQAEKLLDITMEAKHEGLCMISSGMLVINPPYNLDVDAAAAVSFIKKGLQKRALRLH